MKITEPLTIGTYKDKQKIYIKRPCKEFAAIEAYRRAFAEEWETGKQCTHPNLLRYLAMDKDDKGEYIAMEYVATIPLHRAVVEESINLHTESQARKIMMQLLDAVEYLHGKGISHLNIRPENILITRRALDVKLAHPAGSYLNCEPSFFLIKEKYSAPELFHQEEIQQPTACDIYSLGKVMEFLFSFSHLSIGIQQVIRRATDKCPEKRYATVGQLRKALKQSCYTDWGVSLLKGVAVIGVLTLVYYGIKDENTTEESIHFAQEVELHRKELPPSNKAELPDEATSYTLPTSTDSILQRQQTPNAHDEKAAEYQQTAERIFKKEFRKRAEKVINGIYTPQNMTLDDADFQKQSLTSFSQLDKIQRELGEQYHLNPALSMRLSSEVISELTTESMKRLQKD